MYQVKCPTCNATRQVKAKKKWMQGDQPYSSLCKKCCQEGKPKSEEHRLKLSKAVKATQTPDVLAAKSEYMKNHPEVWMGNIRGIGDTFEHSEETKQKIGDGVRATKSRKGLQ